MLYLTPQGKEDIEKSYPDDITFFQATVITVGQFSYCYAILCSIMFIVFHDKMHVEYYYYILNLLSLSIIISIIVNLFLTTITTYKFTGKKQGSFKSVVMKGKYKLGIFTRGSVLRHVIVNPVIDSVIYVMVLLATKEFTELPRGTVEPVEALYCFAISVGLEAFFGITRVLFINNGNAWSREIIVGLACCRILEDVDTNNVTPENMPQEEFIPDNEEKNTPYYRSFVV